MFSVLQSLFFSDESTKLRNQIAETIDQSGIQDITDFQLAISVSDELQQYYDSWITTRSTLSSTEDNIDEENRTRSISAEHTNNAITTDIYTENHQLRSLKEVCRHRLKTVISEILSQHLSRAAGMTEIFFNSDSFVKFVVTLGQDNTESSVKNGREGKRGRHNNDGTKCESASKQSKTENGNLISIVLKRESIVVKGRYRKYSRDVSQTRWLISDEKKRVTTSVEEAIGKPLSEFWKAEGYNLHAAGREDVDVRMLGPGRPFIIVLNNPKTLYPRNVFGKLILMDDLTMIVNQSAKVFGVEICNLHIENNIGIAHREIQNLGEEKRKEYACICRSLQKDLTNDDLMLLNQFKGPDHPLEILQKTPIRVAHRRCLSSRRKIITNVSAILLTPRLFALRLTTEAGRTDPSLSSLLNTAIDLIQLDVIDLKIETE